MATFYEKYWSSKSNSLSDFDLKWPVLSPFIPRERGVKILDVGCGAGHILGEIRHLNPHAALIGLDVSEMAVSRARERMPEARYDVIVDGGPFPLPDRSVDFLFTSEVVEHIYDTENAFREMARVLRPGGRILITTPHHGFIKNLLIVLFNFDRHFNPIGAHVRFFSKKTLVALLEKNGLRKLRVGYYGRFYPISHSIYVLFEKPAQ
jgi:ubiquinone/menaquinone biosynthesis C-methylase UbiE